MLQFAVSFFAFDWIYLPSAIFIHILTECGDNSHVNNLIGNKSKSVPGWTFDLSEGSFDKDSVYFKDCSNGETWFGFRGGSGTGSIQTKLKGCGKGILDIGKLSITIPN